MVFYVCVVGVVGVILLVNVSVFLMVLLQVRRACASEQSGVMKELRGVSSLTLLLGLTWSTAFLTWGNARVPMLYVFSILNSLQGEIARGRGLVTGVTAFKQVRVTGVTKWQSCV